jgi:peroxiredoxin
MKKLRVIGIILAGVAVTAVLAYALGVKAANFIDKRKALQMRAEMTKGVLEKMGTGLGVGVPLPDGEFEDLTGAKVRLSDLACGKTLVVYVEPNCGHCVNQMKAMSTQFVGDRRACGIIVSNISIDGLHEFKDKYGIDCLLLSDIDSRYRKALNIMSFPSNFIVDRNLRIQDVVLGELKDDEIKSLTTQMAKQ